MATNYFEMMRDTVGAYGEGVDVSRRRRAEDERAAREQAAFEQQQKDWAETNQRRTEVNDAVRGLRTTQEGVLQSQNTGMSQPSAQMLYQNGYGGVAGAAAVRDAAGDMNREQARMGLQRTVDPTAGINTRPATDLEINQAAQRVAQANRDLGAWSNIEGNSRNLRLSDARKAELKRLNGMKDNELVGVFQESINANPGVPAMVDFDPKTRKYLVVSQVPGVPTQSLSRAEMLQPMMGLWEAGNGDYNAGIQAVVAGAKGQREIQDKNFERSRGMARGNAGLYFEGRRADNDDARTRNDGARLGLARAEATRRAEAEKLAGGRIRQYVDKAGNIVERYEVITPTGVKTIDLPVPEGMKPYNPRAAGPAREVPAEGAVLQDEGGTFRADGRGGRINVDGIVPSQRESFLKKQGFSKTEMENAAWHPSGAALVFDGKAYTVDDTKAMAQLRADMAAARDRELQVREETARLNTPPRYEPYDPRAAAPRALGRGHIPGESLGLQYR